MGRWARWTWDGQAWAMYVGASVGAARWAIRAPDTRAMGQVGGCILGGMEGWSERGKWVGVGQEGGRGTRRQVGGRWVYV